MNKDALGAVVDRIDGYRDHVISLQRELCSRPALGPESGGDGEVEKAAFLKTYLERLGLQVDQYDSPDDRVACGYRPNLVSLLPGGAKAPRLWIMAHTDVVPPGDPAKWTGNGSRDPQPGMHDWYEAVKINFGVAPDGTQDFPGLPEGYEQESCQVHFDFWKDKEVPDSWVKFRDITLYWIEKGVDGFRYDMAEMVPVEFWSFMNSAIKMAKSDAFLLAEIYQPPIYREYIQNGKMDYLYDKVQLYDSLKAIMQGHGSTDAIVHIQQDLADIEHHMLHFLENHDEQRIASQGFAGDARKGMPAMVISATIGSSPTMLYFGQNAGEPGDGNAGHGSETRTTIYDYWGVPNHIQWMNEGKFDGGKLSQDDKELNNFYMNLLNFTKNSEALTGDYREIHSHNRAHTEWYNDRVFSFVRWKGSDKLIIVANFDAKEKFGFELSLPKQIIKAWKLEEGNYPLRDVLGERTLELIVKEGKASTRIDIEPLESLILDLL